MYSYLNTTIIDENYPIGLGFGLNLKIYNFFFLKVGMLHNNNFEFG